MSDERHELEPHDRLTRLCDAMIQTLDAHEESDGEEKCVIMLSGMDEGEWRGGIVLHGYGDSNDSDAISDLFEHLRAIIRANGGELMIVPLANG